MGDFPRKADGRRIFTAEFQARDGPADPERGEDPGRGEPGAPDSHDTATGAS